MAPELGLSKSQNLDAACGSFCSLLNGQIGRYNKYLHLRTGKNRLYFSSTLNLNCWTKPLTFPKPLLPPQQGFKAHPIHFYLLQRYTTPQLEQQSHILPNDLSESTLYQARQTFLSLFIQHTQVWVHTENINLSLHH